MSTTFAERQMTAVLTPADAEHIRQALHEQKGRWALFLTARDALERTRSGALRALTHLADTVRVDWALTAARRTLGWVLGAATATGRALRIPGVRPAMLWLAFTKPGQMALGHLGRCAGRACLALGRSAVSWTARVLRLFGARGDRAARWLESRSRLLRTATVPRLQAGLGFAGDLLTSSGPLAQGLTSIAQGRALTALLRKVLPGRWALLSQVLAAVVTMPRWARQELLTLATAARGGTPDAEHDDDPTPPAAVVLLQQHLEDPLPFEEPAMVQATMQRHPAKRAQGKRRR